MRIRTAKNGRRYTILRNGQTRFLSSTKLNTKKRGYRTMAKKKSYRSKSKSYGVMGTVLGAVAYGAVREKLSTALTPVTNSIPLGNISDEVALGALAILAKKTIKNPMVSKVADAALVIESARIGEAVISGSIGGMSSSTSNQALLG